MKKINTWDSDTYYCSAINQNVFITTRYTDFISGNRGSVGKYITDSECSGTSDCNMFECKKRNINGKEDYSSEI